MAKKKNSKKLLKRLGILAGILIIFAIIGKKAGWVGGESGTEVTIEKAEKREIIERVSATGQIHPETEVKISPDVSGEIVELHVKDGDSVVAGQLLLKIRPDNFRSAYDRSVASLSTTKANRSRTESLLAQSEARFIQAESEMKRNETLYKEEVLSLAEYEQAKANFEVASQELKAAEQAARASSFDIQSASATVKEAKENLRRTSIFAPSDGTVSALNVEFGEKVVGTAQMAGTEMLRIANLNSMEVRVDVNESDIVRVSLGDTVEIEVDSYPDEEFKGLVTSVAVSANPTATAEEVKEFEVRIRILPESYKKLIRDKSKKFPFRPGMTASVEIITDRKKDVLSIPLSAVTMRDLNEERRKKERKLRTRRSSGDKTEYDRKKDEEDLKEVVFIYNEKEKTVSLKEVKTGISDSDYIEIIKGLKVDEEIVSGPYLAITKRLEDDKKVEITKRRRYENDKK